MIGLVRSWALDLASTEGGFVVQKVTIMGADGTVTDVYWEAWGIGKGETMPTDPKYGRWFTDGVNKVFGNDVFNNDISTRAEAAFYEGLTLKQLESMGFRENSVKSAGSLPAMRGTPQLPNPSTPIVTKSWP